MKLSTTSCLKISPFRIHNTESCFFTTASSKDQDERQEICTSTSYDSEKHEFFAGFVHTFDSKARLIGLPKAIVYMFCNDRDDFTVFIILRKKDKNAKALMHLNFPFPATPIKSSYGEVKDRALIMS